MKKEKIIIPMLLLGFMTIGVSEVSANSLNNYGQGFKFNINKDLESSFKTKADILGLDMSSVKDAWASGKSMIDLAKEKGLDISSIFTKVENQKKVDFQNKMSELVSLNKITQQEASHILEKHNQMQIKNDEIISQVLGMSVSDLKSYKLQGKTLNDIISIKGLNKESILSSLKLKMDEYHLSIQKEELSKLVSDGVLTQKQADDRFETLKNNSNGKNNTRHQKLQKI
jgi:hypothetical protein